MSEHSANVKRLALTLDKILDGSLPASTLYLGASSAERRILRQLVDGIAAVARKRNDFVWWDPRVDAVDPSLDAEVSVALELSSAIGSDFENDETLKLLAALLELSADQASARPLFETVIAGALPDAEATFHHLGELYPTGSPCSPASLLAAVLSMKLTEDGGVFHLEYKDDESIPERDRSRYVWSEPIPSHLSLQFATRVGKALGYEEETRP